MSYFSFTDVKGNHSIHESVKQMSFEQIKATFEGKLDYVTLANKLGIKPTKASKTEPENKSAESKTGKDQK